MNRSICKLVFVLFCCGLSQATFAKRKSNSLEDDVRRLYSHSSGAREQAAANLVAAGASSIPLLLPVVCDKSKPNFDEAWPAAAKALGQLRAEAAAPCLVQLLMWQYPSIGPPVTKSDETLRNADPAFAALVQIGEPAVPAIRRTLPMLSPDAALMAVRVLRTINTPSAKEAAEAYVKTLENQIRLTKLVISDFGR